MRLEEYITNRLSDCMQEYETLKIAQYNDVPNIKTQSMLDTRKKRLFKGIENIRAFLHTLQQEINDFAMLDLQEEE